MEQSKPPTEPATTASLNVAKDERKSRAPNPQRHFASPELLMADTSLTDPEKFGLLKEWSLDIDNRLKAEEEGFSASDPMRDKVEAKLADEARRIQSFLSGLSDTIDQR